MRLVLDTNALLAAVLADGLCRDQVRKRIRPHDLFTCQALLDELGGRLREKFGLNPRDVPLMAAYQERATLVSPSPLAQTICRDPDDDVVLATAVAAEAEFIITGDEDLLILGQHRSVRILSPRQFLEALDRRP